MSSDMVSDGAFVGVLAIGDSGSPGLFSAEEWCGRDGRCGCGSSSILVDFNPYTTFSNSASASGSLFSGEASSRGSPSEMVELTIDPVSAVEPFASAATLSLCFWLPIWFLYAFSLK